MSDSKFSFLNTQNYSIFNKIEELNPFVSSDYHIFKEYRKDITDINQRKLREKESKEIIDIHNSKVGKNDLFLFLGDITEEEYGKEKEYSSILEFLKSKIKLLNGKKYIILGNNDSFNDSFYKDCGFLGIIRESYIETDKYLFSHYPIAIPDYLNKINIHGHIHGSKNYWGMKYENHLDSYYKLWNGPIRFNALLKKYNEYQKGCICDLKKEPERKY